MVFEIRTAADPVSITSALRQALAEIDRDAPFHANTVNEMVAEKSVQDRLLANLIRIFGGLALLLASLGIYGVLAFGASQRTNEIGIRMAVGARSANVLAMILREAFIMLLLGLAIGLIGAVWLTELISSRLVGITPTDPLTLLCAVATMIVIALFASFAPAWRASRVDPLPRYVTNR